MDSHALPVVELASCGIDAAVVAVEGRLAVAPYRFVAGVRPGRGHQLVDCSQQTEQNQSAVGCCR